MSIADKVTQLTNIRAAIRTALISKGISAASSHNFTNFAADISAIPTGVSLQSKSVSPSASAQTVTPDSGYDGLSQVDVAAAPLETRTVTPTAAGLQVEKSSNSYYGLEKVNVNGDANLAAGNIKSGVSIFGVNGSYSPSFQLQSKSATPTTSQQVVTPDSGYDGLSQVTVGAVALQSKNVTPNAAGQTVAPDSGYLGLSAVTLPREANLVPANIRNTISIFGVVGTYEAGTVAEVGALIDVTCSSNITSVIGTISTYTATAYKSGNHAYLVIPKDYTGTLTITGYNNGTQVAQTTVTITAIDKYTAQLSTASWVYNNGVWTGVTEKVWTKFSANYIYDSYSWGAIIYSYSNTLDVDENASNLEAHGVAWEQTVSPYYTYHYYYKPAAYLNAISSRGYTKARVKVEIPASNAGNCVFRVGFKIDAVPGTGSDSDLNKNSFTVYHDTTGTAGTAVSDEFVLDFGQATDNLYLVCAIMQPYGSSAAGTAGYGRIKEIQFE